MKALRECTLGSGGGFEISKLGKQYKCSYRLVLETQTIRVHLWKGCHWTAWPPWTWTPWIKWEYILSP